MKSCCRSYSRWASVTDRGLEPAPGPGSRGRLLEKLGNRGVVSQFPRVARVGFPIRAPGTPHGAGVVELARLLVDSELRDSGLNVPFLLEVIASYDALAAEDRACLALSSGVTVLARGQFRAAA